MAIKVGDRIPAFKLKNQNGLALISMDADVQIMRAESLT